MKSAILWTLAGLNVVLLAMLVGNLIGDNNAVAQVRRPAEYLMIPGEVVAGTTGVVYVVDASNGQLTAMTFDDTGRDGRIVSMPSIDLNRVFETGGRGTR